MLLQEPSRLPAAQAVADMVVCELEPAERDIHIEILAAGYGAPVQIIDQLVPPRLFDSSAVRVYSGVIDDEAVSTGMAITLGDVVGVFNVATVPEGQGRGYGGAVTARLVADALVAGARLACLQSSPEGLGLYGRLGFETIEMWPCWVTSSAA